MQKRRKETKVQSDQIHVDYVTCAFGALLRNHPASLPRRQSSGNDHQKTMNDADGIFKSVYE